MADSECGIFEVKCGLEWLADELKSILLWVYDSVMSGVAFIIESIPVPDFLANLQSYTIPPSVSWAADPFNIPAGIAIIVSAYTARFILRRIPFIG